METVAKNTMDRQEFFRLVGISVGAIVLQQCLSGCNSNTNSEPHPQELTINLNNGTYSSLRNRGSYIYQNGIIIAHTNQDSYIAVSQACTHQGTTVVFDAPTNTFVCANHGSVFSERGEVQKGPATKPLTVYVTQFNATTGELKIIT